MAMDHAMPARGAASSYCSSDIGTGRSSGHLAAHPLLPCPAAFFHQAAGERASIRKIRLSP